MDTMESDSTIIKAFFVKAGKIKDKFLSSRCVLGISIGQPYHEGDKLNSTINLINANFQSCTIMLGDTLQRYTLQIDGVNDHEMAYQQSLQAGDAWLVRNKNIINQFTIPHEIIRWDKWLDRSDYKNIKFIIDLLYINDKEFRISMQNTIHEFLVRHYPKSNNQDLDYKKVFGLSLEYLKEECVVLMPICAKENYPFIIYPSNMIEVVKAARKRLVGPYFNKENFVRWLRIKFKRINA